MNYYWLIGHRNIMLKSIVLALTLTTFCLSTVSAQTTPPLTGKVASIIILGNQNISTATIRATLALKVGDLYSLQATKKDSAAILSMGVFQNTVSVTATPDPTGGVDLAYTVAEYPIVRTIRFTANTPTGQPSVPTGILFSQMKTQIGQVLNVNILKSDLDTLFNHSTGYYEQQGHLADVGANLDIDPKTGVVTIPLVEYHVESLQITGNSRVKTADILTHIHIKTGDLYDSNALNNDLSSIYEMGEFKQVGDFTWRTPTPGQMQITIPVVEHEAAVGTLDEKQGKVVPFLYDPITAPFPVVQVSINGQPALPFIVDTGTTFALSLTPWAAEKLGVTPSGQEEKNDVNISFKRTSIRGVVLQGINHSNDIAFSTLEAQVLDLSLLTQFFLNQHIAGIVGLGMLLPVTSRFDFAAKTLTVFTYKHPPLSIPGRRVLPLRSNSDGDLTVRATLAPDTYADLILDTGSDSTQVPLSALTVLHPTAITCRAFYGRLDGISLCPTIRLPKLMLGALQVPDVVVGTLPPPTRLSLGMDILAGYRLTLDVPNAQAILEPSAHSGRYVLGLSGLDIKQSGDFWSISEIEDELPAHHAGLHVGDEIVTVGGISVKGLSRPQIGRLLSGVSGTPVHMLIRRHPDKRVTASKTIALSWVPLDEFSAPPTVVDGLAMEKTPSGPWTIMDVTKGCPGDLAGLQVGDRITQINGEPVASMSLDRCGALFRKSSVSFEVERVGMAQPFSIRLSVTTPAVNAHVHQS